MYLLYNALVTPLRGVARGRAMLARTPESRREWRERTARDLPDARDGSWWLHGASVGEARLLDAVAARARRLHADLRIVGSATTLSGRELLARSRALAASFYAPLDVAGWPGRVLDAVRPAGLGMIETELWPNWIREAGRRGIPVAVVNARLSPRRMTTYRRFGSLYASVLANVTVVAAQSAADAERFEALGAAPERIEVTGNLKFDLPEPAVDRTALRRRFGIALERPVVVAGSTGAGEESEVLDAFARLRAAHPETFLVLAPRHPVRAPEVETEVARRGLRCHRLSSHADHEAGSADVLLVDSIGELGALYTLTAAAFVGGSLVPIGGHNVLEPVAAGAAVSFGPHTEHAADPAEALLEAGAATRVRDGEELGAWWSRLVGQPEEAARMAAAGRTALAAHRGALDRTVRRLARTFGTPA